ncbi:MAG: ArsR family transcriptional regulator [Bacteroidota bacterium]|nr:ArsR family transcriptional regulator [Bacteroidota bacterium]
MFDILISSKTRIKILLKFFLNENSVSYLRGLEEEFGDSTNGIRLELNKFEKAGFLNSYTEGNKKFFKANQKHLLFNDLRQMLMKITGINHLVDYVMKHIGNLEKVYLIGQLAKGLESDAIELVFVGDINIAYLEELIGKAEKKLNKKITFICYLPSEFDIKKIQQIDIHPLLIWNK